MAEYIITNEQRETLIAYQQYTDVALQYLAGQGKRFALSQLPESTQNVMKGRFRDRVADDALENRQKAMQLWVKRLLQVAVVSRDDREVIFRLPARGRIGLSEVLDCPRFAVGEGPTALLVRAGRRELISDFEEFMVTHTVQLDRNGRGPAVMFGNMIPFDLSYSS